MLFTTIDGLKQRGHEVAEFSLSDPRNRESEYAGYFPKALGELSGMHTVWDAVRIFWRIFRSPETVSKLKALVVATDPQVVHMHNVYHHFPPAVFKTLKQAGIPIVLTVHDVQPMCPNHRMMRGVDNKLCEACRTHKYYRCAVNRCIQNSYLKGAAGALEAYVYWLRGVWASVDRFICPSEFFVNKMVEWGFDKNKLRLVRNPEAVSEECPPLGNKVVYLGRFHIEKGIRTFLRALPYLRELPAVIIGDGPENEWVEDFIRQYSLTNVEKMAWADKAIAQQVLLSARVVVIPSSFYENCSMAILEAMSLGRIVVATDRGGNRELVADGITGYLVPADDPDALAAAVKKAMNLSPEEANKMSANARERVRRNHSEEEYFAKLEAVFKEVV